MMDPRKLISNLERHNLSTYFILPLLELNRSNFVESNFIDSYLTTDGLNIFVKVNFKVFFDARMISNLYYQATWTDEEGLMYTQYIIPAKWEQDVKQFLNGKYSHMSDEAKEMIIKWSGLQYRVRRKSDNIPITDVRLLALERSISFRELLEEFYNIQMDESDELLSKPGAKAFIDPTLLTMCEKEIRSPKI